MMQLHPEFLTKDGKREFAVLPYEEFVALQEILADAADLIDLRAAKSQESSAVSAPLREVKDLLGMRSNRGSRTEEVRPFLVLRFVPLLHAATLNP
jgi:hypothetical protein